MKPLMRTTLRLTAALLLVTVLFGSGLNRSVAYAAPCTPDTFRDLWAKTGSALLYGSTSVTIWGYSDTELGAAVLPGPALDVNQGNCVQVTLHNNLTEPTALLFQGQAMIPDTTGAAAGGTQTYIFAASNPGTFLYEAGLVPGKQHQVAMGLYGAMIVHPTVPSTAFDVEKTLVLSEFDATLAASPLGYDMRKYAPKYFLINGKAYPGTASSFAAAGNRVLLRYVNAGLQAHAMSTLGVSQEAIAMDGHAFAYSHKMVAETIAPGQTLDAIVTIPASAMLGTQYAIYDANLMLRNSNTSGLGGMLTFLTVGTPPPPGPDTTGPLLSSLTLTPNPSNGAVSVALAFTANDTTTGGSNVTAAEYWIDAGAHTPVTVGSPATVVNLSATIAAGLTHGTHVVSVRAQDALGNWSATGTINLVVDNVGPTSSGLSLTPNPSNGAVSVTLTFTANDSASGNSNITAAEYWIDPVGIPADGTGTSVSVAAPAPIKTLNATIAAGLSAGTHIVSVHSKDALNNWGARVTINLIVDQTGPVTSGVSASPNPNNGYQELSTSVQAVRVTASFSDTASGGSNIATAEGFIDTMGVTGTGFVFIATDGSFNSSTENGNADIPLAVIGSLSPGNHTIYVHAKDAAGNWGATSTTVLVINKSLYFSTTGNTNPPTVGGTADDADIYLWNGTAFSRVIDASVAPYSLPASGSGNANVDGFDRVDATHFYMSFAGQVNVPGIGNVQDEDIVYYNAGTWSLYFDGSVNGLTSSSFDLDAISVVGAGGPGNIYFSTDNTNVPAGAGGTGDDADIYRWNGGSSYTRIFDASALGWSSANVDGFVWVDPTHFYMSYSVDTTVPGLGTVQDEDVVYYKGGGTWVVYFDGTAKGLTDNNHDVDAFDVP